MPNTMPGNTSRGYVIRKMEAYVNAATAPQLGLIMTDLKQKGSNRIHMLEILQKQYIGGVAILDSNVAADAWHLKHLQWDWFGDPTSTGSPKKRRRGKKWRGTSRSDSFQPLDKITRTGLWTALHFRKTALELAAPLDIPIFIIWVCAGHHFELHVFPFDSATVAPAPVDWAAQISVLIVTPHESDNPERTGLSTGGEFTPGLEEFYVIRHELADEEDVGYAIASVPNAPTFNGVRIYQPLTPAMP